MPNIMSLAVDDCEEEFRDLPVATEEELLTFANKVRKAGGADVLDALLPAEMNRSESCLIARAINFSSAVIVIRDGHGDGQRWPCGSWKWGMMPQATDMTDEKLAEIAEKIDCEVVDHFYRQVWPHRKVKVLLLPIEIGNAARAFDTRIAFGEYRA